jgi:transaldolase/glucose-6-phosphate isomerase
VDQAHKVLDSLPGLGIDLQAATQQLEDEGVQKFVKAFDQLMSALKEKQAKALQESLDRQSFQLGNSQPSFEKRVHSLADEHFSERLWRKDASLWKSDPQEQKQICDSLGWLHVAEKIDESVQTLHNFLAEVRDSGLRHVVLMGMGGSSLAPIVFKRTFPVGQDGLPVDVLDSTDPATILDLERRIPVADTLFIVSSKSGTTTEPLAFNEYFYDKVKSLRGDRAGQNFVAITDPGTPLVKLAQDRDYRKVFTNFPDIGGRYSALSYFGLVPAALMGLDVEEILIQALRMVHACDSCVPARENPGLTLGAALGELARHHKDKVTFLMPASIGTFGLWLEQLLAESTGKEGKGLIPVAGEPPGDPSVYGQDRFFVYTRLMNTQDATLDSAVSSLQSAGQPVATIIMDELMDISQEFFRWEYATAVAGAVLGINPFDQPNVQESKDNTKRLLEVVKEQGKLPEENPVFVQGDLQFYAQGSAANISQALQEFLDQAKPGDYVALQAYLTENDANDRALQTIRLRLRDHLHLATTLGYGPRFLHSTGQLHKGGPNTGLFIQLTCQEDVDVPIPNSPYTFGVLKQAQALGDLQALRKHGRRAIRIDLGKNAVRGLSALDEELQSALAGMAV